MAAVGPLTDHRGEQLGPLVAIEHVEAGEHLGLGRRGRLEQAGGEQALFAAIDMDQLDRWARLSVAAPIEAEP